MTSLMTLCRESPALLAEDFAYDLVGEFAGARFDVLGVAALYMVFESEATDPAVFSTVALGRLLQAEKYCTNCDGSTVLHWICAHNRAILDEDYWLVPEPLEFAALRNKFGHVPAEIHLDASREPSRGAADAAAARARAGADGSTLYQELQGFMHARGRTNGSHPAAGGTALHGDGR